MHPLPLLLAALLSEPPVPRAPAQGAPSIEIGMIPVYGSSGHLSGKVTGVSFAAHRVTGYILVQGVGWVVKPSVLFPSVPILPDGSFSIPIGTDGLDEYATSYGVCLLPATFQPPAVVGVPTLPDPPAFLATDLVERFGRTLTFAGREWGVKEAPLPVDPGQNLFSAEPDDVFVDLDGRLHLRVAKHGAAWWSTEVVLLETLGTGTYSFVTETEVEDLDPNVTFGAFTWDDLGQADPATGNVNREIDFVEHSRWGNPALVETSQYVVQPPTTRSLHAFVVPDLAGSSTLSHFGTWTPDRVEFLTALGLTPSCDVPPASVVEPFVFQHDPALGHHVPVPGTERMRFNLWINTGDQPASGAAVEVIVSDFRFSPEPSLYPLGCGINPAHSLVLLQGSATLGTTLVLGVDNPAGTQTAGAHAFVGIGMQPDPSLPCGTVLPGLGMTAAGGELLIGLTPQPLAFAAGTAWAGPGAPARVALQIPANPLLVGQTVYAQGILIDATPGSPPIGLTDGFALCFQP
jgi:hypothetical protein